MNVADMRKSCAPGGRWDGRTVAAIGCHMLDAIAGMHLLGFIHRDIKPANFAITPRFEVAAKGAVGLRKAGVCAAGVAIHPKQHLEHAFQRTPCTQLRDSL